MMGETLDSKSLLLSQFSSSDQPQFLQLATESFMFERGPRYRAYADLRESRLRLKHRKQPVPIEEDEEEEEDLMALTPPPPPPKKQVKFQGSMVTPPRRSKGSSVLAQSVPDFSYALRKENRKPPVARVVEKSATPPPLGRKSGKLVGGVGSKSVNSGDKRIGGGMMTRRSYACLEEFKGLASAARNAINGDNRAPGNGRSSSRVGPKTVLGHRQL